MSPTRKRMKEQLEEIIDEMVSKGIYWSEAVTQFEKLFITRSLDQSNGNLSRGAEIMGVHRNTLTKKIREYGIKKKKRRR